MRFSFLLVLVFPLLFTSCQKELTNPLPGNTPTEDSTTNARIIRWNEYFYNSNGTIINDSSLTIYQYDDLIHKTTILEKDWYSGGNLNSDEKSERFFDANNNWTKEYIYSDNLTIALKGQFIRNATGLPEKYIYERNTFNPPGIQSFTSNIYYKLLSTGEKEITVVDTSYDVYPSLAYYQVFLDATGKPKKISHLSWSKNEEPQNIYFYYNSNNEIVKEVDSTFYLNQVISVITDTYTYDTLPSHFGKNLNLSLKGKDFWWFSQDKFYYLNHWAYLDKESGSFIKEHSKNIKQLNGGTILSNTTENFKTSTQYDKLAKCITSTIYENNIRVEVVKYYFEQK
jgi:hypothetical protein